MLLLTFSEREEAERFRIEVGIDSEDVENDSRRRSVVSGSDDHSVAEDDDEFPLVVVLESSQRVDGLLERILSFGVAGNLADEELVVILRRSMRSEVESSEELESDDGDHDEGEDEEDVGREETLRRLTIVDHSDQEARRKWAEQTKRASVFREAPRREIDRRDRNRYSQVSQASHLPIENVHTERVLELVQTLGDVLSGGLLKELNDRWRDERRRIRGLGLVSVGSSEVRRVVDVIVETVNVIIVNGDSFSSVSSSSNRLGKDADESESEVVSHVNHLLEVPVGSRVVGEGSEIVVDGVGVPGS